MGTFRAKDFHLQCGAVLPELEIAFEVYGSLNANRDNAILTAHGLTSTHLGGDEPTLDRRRGWWSEIIGPGKLLDTDRYCIISSNILGSSYGSTGPASINPETGKPFGATFPQIDYVDIVNAQHLMLCDLGVSQLTAVAGASIGGFQVFQWAVSYPEFMKGILALDTAPWDPMNVKDSVPELMATLSADPNWNDGDYYSSGGVTETLTKMRIATLHSYGIEEKLAKTHTSDEIEELIETTAREWAEEFDAHALIRQMQASGDFDLSEQLDRIRAQMFYVLCDTDELFPSSIGNEVVTALTSNGVNVTFHEISSDLGHYATTDEPEKWVPAAAEFLDQLWSRSRG
jgi:homoserine O-acetyltransferase